jgi:hypothetical protein
VSSIVHLFRHCSHDDYLNIRVGAGQNTTLFLAKIPLAPYTPGAPIVEPSQVDTRKMEKYQDLPRHPFELDDTPELCMVCKRDNGEDDSPLECDKVR